MEGFISLTREIEKLYSDGVKPMASLEGSAMLNSDLEYTDNKKIEFEVENVANVFGTFPLVTEVVKKILIETALLSHRIRRTRKFNDLDILDHVIRNLKINGYPAEIIAYHMGAEDRQLEICQFMAFSMQVVAGLEKDIYIGWLDKDLVGGSFEV